MADLSIKSFIGTRNALRVSAIAIAAFACSCDDPDTSSVNIGDGFTTRAYANTASCSKSRSMGFGTLSALSVARRSYEKSTIG